MPTPQEVESLRQMIHDRLPTQVSIYDRPDEAGVAPAPPTDLFQVYYANGSALLIVRADDEMLIFIFNVDTFPTDLFTVERAVERTPIPVVTIKDFWVELDDGNLVPVKGQVFINDTSAHNGRLILTYTFKVHSCDAVFGIVEHLSYSMDDHVEN